jgi:hypothetical protein
MRIALACFFLPALLAQSLQQEDILRLARIKSAISRHLTGMPNYTCLQTVERYQRMPNARRDSLIDVLRLEVAFVAGREMFAWPGSTQFEANELRDIVTTGAFSTGSFVLHAKAIFLGDGTTFRFGGVEDLGAVAVYRFDYDTAQFRSGYEIRNPTRGLSARVAYHGSIWARRDTLELMRISIEADEIPPEIEIELATDRLDYQLAPIGSTEALLPLQSEVRITDNKGVVAINKTRLSRCKQYAGESTLRFDDVDEAALEAAKPKRELVFDPHTELELEFVRELNHEDFAVGDVIEAVLRRDVKEGRTVIAPKGSVAKGRILRLEHQDGQDSTYNITLQFDELVGDGWRAPLRLRLVRTEPAVGLPPRANLRDRVMKEFTIPETHPNGFVVFAKKLKLPRGFVTIWQTQK